MPLTEGRNFVALFESGWPLAYRLRDMLFNHCSETERYKNRATVYAENPKNNRQGTAKKEVVMRLSVKELDGYVKPRMVEEIRKAYHKYEIKDWNRGLLNVTNDGRHS